MQLSEGCETMHEYYKKVIKLQKGVWNNKKGYEIMQGSWNVVSGIKLLNKHNLTSKLWRVSTKEGVQNYKISKNSVTQATSKQTIEQT